MDMHYYFDTNAFLKYYNIDGNELGVEQIRTLVETKQKVLISELTLLEAISVLKKAQRRNPNKKKHILKTINQILLDIQLKFIKIPLPANTFNEAQNILLENGKESVGSLDALHAAIVQNLNAEVYFVTSDGSTTGGLIGLCRQLKIAVYDPEKNMYF
jgi:predicted nucleic acid-binding protein